MFAGTGEREGNILNSFMQNLYYYRRREGLSQIEFAKRLGVTPHTVANYESGRTAPTMEIVIRIAHVLNISTDQLLGYTLTLNKDKYISR